jgi:hypothetical protein
MKLQGLCRTTLENLERKQGQPSRTRLSGVIIPSTIHTAGVVTFQGVRDIASSRFGNRGDIGFLVVMVWNEWQEIGKMS